MKSGKDVKQDLKTADELVNQLKRIYNEGYTAHAIDITKHFVHHVKGQGQFESFKVMQKADAYYNYNYGSSILTLKGTLDKLDRSTDEFKEFRQGLQSSILEHLSKKEYESRWAALIFCATICKISNEIFLEETIIVNRIDDLTREIYLPKNRKPFKKQIELAELLSHVTGTHFGKQFERKAQSRKYDDVHDLFNQENVSDVKRRDLTKYRFCLGWFLK